MYVESSSAIAFRWFSFLQSTRKNGKVDTFGFPKASAKNNPDLAAFEDVKMWHEDSGENFKGKQSPTYWFFDVQDSDAAGPVASWGKPQWHEEDDIQLLDELIGDDIAMPGLGLISSSGDKAAWQFPGMTRRGAGDAFSSSTETSESFFDPDDLDWDESKQDLSGESDFYMGDFADNVSELTNADPEDERQSWYRNNVSSMVQENEKPLGRNELDVWPKTPISIVDKVSEVPPPIPTLVEVPPHELARRFFAMQQRLAKQQQIARLSKSDDASLRRDVEESFREMWNVTYQRKKLSRNTPSTSSSPSREYIA